MPKLDFEDFTDSLKLLHLDIINLYVDQLNPDITIITEKFPNLETFLFSGQGYRNLMELKKLKKLKV